MNGKSNGVGRRPRQWPRRIEVLSLPCILELKGQVRRAPCGDSDTGDIYTVTTRTGRLDQWKIRTGHYPAQVSSRHIRAMARKNVHRPLFTTATGMKPRTPVRSHKANYWRHAEECITVRYGRQRQFGGATYVVAGLAACHRCR